MTTYELPAEPDVDTIWTTYSPGASAAVTTWKWTREGAAWRKEGAPGVRSWLHVLSCGVVHDVHPDLGTASPTPWRWDDDGAWLIRDARDVPMNPDDLANALLIVRAVNAYAEGLT